MVACLSKGRFQAEGRVAHPKNASLYSSHQPIKSGSLVTQTYTVGELNGNSAENFCLERFEK